VSLKRRHLLGALSVGFTVLCTVLAAGALVIILADVAIQGFHAIDIPFITQLPHPEGVPGGGIANGIAGSAITVALATLMAIPVGIMTGIYLALFGRGFIAETIRFLSDVLSGIPSIAIGLFAYVLLVAPFKHFSAISASFAFAILMLPLIIRTSEQAIRSVPVGIREGALALGMSVFSSTTRIILATARPAIVTGLLLAIARVTGETAPLLFTALGSPFWQFNPSNPMAQLPLQIFEYAISPYQDQNQQAWGCALLLIVAVLILNFTARLMLSRGPRVE
jgi:phosphate transport system permease protein